MLTCDSGSSANWFARDLKLRHGMSATVSGSLATMGCGVPYAIGAKFANPTRPVIALVGDGAMQMNGNGELLTLAKYYKQWRDPRFIVVVLNNGDLNMVTWEMRAMAGDTRYAASQDLPDFPYAEYARMQGLGGIRVDRADRVAAVVGRGACDEPTLRHRSGRGPRRTAASTACLARANGVVWEKRLQGRFSRGWHLQTGDCESDSLGREKALTRTCAAPRITRRNGARHRDRKSDSDHGHNGSHEMNCLAEAGDGRPR